MGTKALNKIRRATVGELNTINDLIMSSKSYWDYDPEYLEGCRQTLRLDEDYLQSWPCFVMETGDKVLAGFSSIVSFENKPELHNLWILPEYIGRGLGKNLFLHMMDEAKAKGWMPIRIVADPFAEDFYKKLGAVNIGQEESKVKSGFFLPLLQYGSSLKESYS